MSEKLSKSVAERLSASLRKLDVAIGNLDKICSELESLPARKAKENIVQSIGDLLQVSDEMLRVILHFHPELDPDAKN